MGLRLSVAVGEGEGGGLWVCNFTFYEVRHDSSELHHGKPCPLEGPVPVRYRYSVPIYCIVAKNICTQCKIAAKL